MARPFDITTTSDTASTTAGSSVRLVLTVTNTTSRPLRGSLRAKALDSAQAAWLTVAGDAERDFPPGLAHQVEVTVKVPPNTPPGRFRVRLDALSVANPDDDFAEGPAIGITVAEPQGEKKSGLPWWVWLVVGVVVLVLVGVVAWLALRDKPEVPPTGAIIPADLVGMRFAQAQQRLQDVGLTVARKDANVTDSCPDLVISSVPAPGASAASGAAVTLTVGVLPFGPDTCRQGFVWREAFDGDHVCVTPASRSRAAQDNQLSSSRSEVVPGTAKDLEEFQRTNPKAAAVPKGDFGAMARVERGLVFNARTPQTFSVVRCIAGFTERRARADDRICVTTATQLATAAENDQAASTRACPKP